MKFKLENLDPCRSSLQWVNEQKSYKDAWSTCERGDWMLWIAKRQDVDLRKLTAAKVACAKLIIHLMKDERSIKALEVAERFSQGNATREELAAYAADAAAYAAYAAYAAAAAAAAADADADAYAAAAYAADAAAYAAYAAADAAADAADAAYAAEREDVLKKSADLVREHIAFDDLGIS